MSNGIKSILDEIHNREIALREIIEQRDERWILLWDHLTSKATVKDALNLESQLKATSLVRILYYIKHDGDGDKMIELVDELIK
jgi:hypothetical protein